MHFLVYCDFNVVKNYYAIMFIKLMFIQMLNNVYAKAILSFFQYSSKMVLRCNCPDTNSNYTQSVVINRLLRWSNI